MKRHLGWLTILALLLLMAAAAWLRMAWLGNVFQSSDNAELADKILRHKGWEWMVYEKYGLLINAWVKLFTGVFCLLGGRMNEFWWKLPVAVAGTLSVWVAFRFVRRLGVQRGLALMAAALVAMLPIHVFQSRYLWGYEVLGMLCLMLVVPALVSYFEAPSLKRGLLASFLLGLYMISHGYFLPLVPGLLLMMLLLGPEPVWWRRLLRNAWGMLRHLVLLFPLGFWPLYRASLKHALRKESHFGFYLDDHFMGFLGNLGWLLLALVVLGWLAPLWCPKPRRKVVAVVAGLSLLYLAPLFFASPPGLTVVRGYMLIGCGMGLLAFVMGVEGIMPKARQLLVFAGWVGALFTGVSTASVLFIRPLGEIVPNLLSVQVERGSVPPDPKVKAAGYLFRKNFPPSVRVLSLHYVLEPPVFRYYFGPDDNDHLFYDLPAQQYPAKFKELEKEVDVVIIDGTKFFLHPPDSTFELCIMVEDKRFPIMEIYARKEIAPESILSWVVEPHNDGFDKEFSPTVKLY